MIGFPVFLSVTNFSLSGFFTDALTSVVKKRATDLTAPTFFTSTLTEVKVAGDTASSNTPVLLLNVAVSSLSRFISVSDPFKKTLKSLILSFSAIFLLVVIGTFTVTSNAFASTDCFVTSPPFSTVVSIAIV